MDVLADEVVTGVRQRTRTAPTMHPNPSLQLAEGASRPVPGAPTPSSTASQLASEPPLPATNLVALSYVMPTAAQAVSQLAAGAARIQQSS
jgi:hypothetical protein